MTASAGFDAALSSVATVEGWMTADQAHRLWEAARRVPAGGSIVEIGSFRGRSAILLARAAQEGVAVVAIDPHGGGDRGPNEIAAEAARGEEDHRVFQSNIERAGVSHRIRHVRKPSQEALDAVQGRIEMLYVDGAHRYAPARADIERWGERVSLGGTMLIHDWFNAVGVTLASLHLLVPSSEWRYVGRTGSLAEFHREPLQNGRRVENAIRQVAELPYFVRNGLIKVALIAHFRPLARLLGHHTGDWPY
jgi:predicted O-methyltransferase YrrM